MKHVPNLITSLNLVSGFIGIIFASRGDLVSASWLITAAMVFDYLDGFSARMLKAYSDLGKELDSLADIVSFGIAPGIIIFHLLINAISPDALMLIDQDPFKSAIIFLPAIMPVCAALRLAKFNLDTSQAKIFKGLPTPANAIAVISIVFALNFSDLEFLKTFTRSPFLLLLYTLVLSLLMVSGLPLLSMKISHVRFKGNEGRYLLAGLIITGYIITGSAVLTLIIPFYLIASAIHFGFSKS